MSSDWKHLEKEFKQFRLEEEPLAITGDDLQTKCSCSDISIVKSFSLLEVANIRKLKVKDKKRSNHQLIKPARLKFIGNCYAKKLKELESTEKEDDAKIVAQKEIENYTSKAFFEMRISSQSETIETSPLSPAFVERLPSTSSSSSSPSLNCSTQAKLQHQLSSTECPFDSTIDEMSDFLAYHLSLYNKKFNLIDSMYT